MNLYFTAAVAGLTAGGAYALLGVCAAFTYRLVAVVNFVGAAIGAAGAFAFAMLVEHKPSERSEFAHCDKCRDSLRQQQQ